MSIEWKKLIGLLILCLPSTVWAEPLCPGGEITLGPGRLRVLRTGSVSGTVASTRGTFALPAGVPIAPASEPIVFALEADRQPVGAVTLAAGELVARSAGRRFMYRVDGSTLSLRRTRGAYQLSARFNGFDLAGLDFAQPPTFLKQILKIGDDCFASVLACSGGGDDLLCTSDRTVLLAGRVERSSRAPLPGTMVTLIDDARLETVSVFAQEDGRYVFPRLRPGPYRLRARLIGYDDALTDVTLAKGRVSRVGLTMSPTTNTNDQLPASAWFSLLLDKWPDPKIRGDFTLSCGNCHQIGGYRFRRAKTEDQWRAVLTRMMTNLPPYFQETRDLLIQNVIDTYGPNATYPTLPVPPPPSGDILRAVIYEYILGNATSSPGCHDLELGADNRVYADAGLRWIDPRTSERGVYPFVGGSHSIERGPDGNMWITQAGSDSLSEVYADGVTPPRYFPLPRIGDDQGAYPHTLRFNSQGQIWMTMTKSNHVALFDPPTAQWTYHRLPDADPAEVGLSIPVAYGCDTAPDDSVWWSQLFGERIGRWDPATDTMKFWRPPFYGPRRLSADQDGIAWVPGYASGVLGRFDPTTERWKVYPMPTGIAGPPGFGTSETPYNLNANRRNGQVWINGSDSDTLIRFEPGTERFTAFPLPTRGSFTREIEFDPDNNPWTCTSNETPAPGEPGRGKFVKVELPPPGAECGNRRVEQGEECDDGNTTSCDGCSAACRRETGCGDGSRCGAEACDDGNAGDCDGCSAACEVETGLRCGDGIVNAACGEECEPPGVGGCGPTCTPAQGCGNGIVEGTEACDDGDADDCDGCTSRCTPTTGCGDGVRCGAEACDDGNATSCDGCSATCGVETGIVCGDGVVNAVCGEECDPPAAGTCAYDCRSGVAAALGTRPFSFGGALYSSALGTAVPLGLPEGGFDLTADAPAIDGTANVGVAGPVYFRIPILGGAFGYFCGRITSCTGHVYCRGGQSADVRVEQDSAGPGRQGNPIVTTTGLGLPGGPGTVVLTCDQSTIQVAPPEPDCTTQTYPADQPLTYTTGSVTGLFLNGDPRIGTGMITITGEPFACAQWTTTDGPGVLVGSFLQEADSQAGDTANGLRLDD